MALIERAVPCYSQLLLLKQFLSETENMRLNLVLLTRIKNLPRNYGNFPEAYVKKQTQFKQWEPPKLPNYIRKTIRYRNMAYYDMNAPWTQDFHRDNAPNNPTPRIFVEPHKEFPVFVGDLVEVTAGKDKGKQGYVNFVVKERNWVCVDNLNLGYTFMDKTADNPGICVAETLPLLYGREVRLIDPNDRKPTLIEWRYDEEGNDVRISLRSGRVIPIPPGSAETYDYKVKEVYVEQPKDTPAKLVEETTFEAVAKTFEMDIMDEMGIKDDRVPYQMYWY